MTITCVSQRRFGVEIEHGNKNTFKEYGQADFAGSTFVRNELDKAGFGRWTVDNDGTGIEAKTPVLQGAEGYDFIARVLPFIESIGGFITRHDGMHVHHEALDYIKDFDGDSLARLARTWLNNVDVIDKFVAPNRRKNGCCNKNVTEEKIKQIQALKGKKKVERLPADYMGYTREAQYGGLGLPDDNRGALNLVHVWQSRYAIASKQTPSKPTIELRLHEGTLDPEEALAWITFGQRLLDRVMELKRPIAACAHPEQLVERLKIDGEPAEALLRKAACSDNKKMKGSVPWWETDPQAV